MALSVEIARASLRYDRLVKLPLDAGDGIRELWIVDLEAGAVEVYRDPQRGAYRRTQRLEGGAGVTPEAFPHVAIAVSDIVG